MSISVTVDNAAVVRAINEMQQRSIRLQPAFKVIGEAMLNSTQQRFRDEEAPDGTPWESLSPVTEAIKGHSRILEGETFELARQISYEATDDTLEWGSSMVYAAMQQFGGEQSDFPHLWGDIPARPFLGVSDADEDEILEILREHLG